MPALDSGLAAAIFRISRLQQPENNDFLLVSQFSAAGDLYTCRPDLVGFVNGLPWVVIGCPLIPDQPASQSGLAGGDGAALMR